MAFPEIAARVKNWLAPQEPITLGLKGGVAIDQINAGWYARNGFPGIYHALSGGAPSWSGEAVTIDSALNHSVVYACTRIIAESVGMTPALMYQEKNDAKQPAKQHPMYRALKNAPNAEISAMGFTETHTAHAVLTGGGFAHIIRRSGAGTAIELESLLPSQVRPDREKDNRRRLVYVVKDGNEPERTYTVESGKPQDILHIRGLGWNGLNGFSVITMARQSIGTAQAVERSVGSFYANGSRMPYNLKLTQRMEPDKFDKFRADWERIYSDPHRVPILEPWFDYQQIGINMKDQQMLESRQFTVPEICRWFGVSPHLAGDLSRATFSNIEQLALEFVKFTLGGWLKRWEEDLWRCVLTPDEQEQGYFFYHDTDALLRGDFATRMAGYSTMLQNGIASVNEVRNREGLNAIEGGGAHHIQLNQATLPGTGEPTASQQATLTKLGPKE